jgi:hypothetical protein
MKEPYKTGKCSSCGAEIVWLITDSGKRAPMNYPPVKRFIVTSVADGQYLGRMCDTFDSHFSTCPDAGRHRKEPRNG